MAQIEWLRYLRKVPDDPINLLSILTWRSEKSSLFVEPYVRSWVLTGRHGRPALVRAWDFGAETMNDERKPVGQKEPMETAANRNKTTAKPGKLGREVQARLGQQLRAMYDDVVSQGVPDRFADLLNRLEGNGNKDKH